MQANSSTQPPVKSPDVLSTAKRRIYSDEFLLTKSRLVLEVRDGLALEPVMHFQVSAQDRSK